MVWFGSVAAALCAAFLLCAPSNATAGAFTLEPGEGKVFALGQLTAGDEYFDRQGKRHKRGRYTKYDLQLYGEYGVLDGLTLFASGGYQKIKARDVSLWERDGLGRSEFGARARLYSKGGWIVSAQASGVIAGAKKKDGIAAIGETDDQADVRGLVARTFEIMGKPAFVDLGAGYRWRGGDPANEVRIDSTFGIRPWPRLLLLAQSFNQIGTERWKGPYALKQRIHKAQFGAIYDLTERLSVFAAGLFSLSGRDSLNERGATLGLGYRF